MSRGERWVVWVAAATVIGTGVGYGVLRYLLATTDEWGVAAHPLEPLALKLHVVSAPILVFAVGLIAVRHILAHLQQGVRQGRRSGITALSSLLPMIASGYGIQVVTDERWLLALAWIHGVTGGLFAIGAIGHFITLRVLASQASEAPDSPPLAARS